MHCVLQMDSTSEKNHRWAVVLAGGDGARLRGLTHLISGDPRPKQFCPFFGGKTLLAHTRERIRPLFNEQQTLFSLTRPHQRYYSEQLWDVADECKLVQPENRGTALAIALCLHTIVSRDEEARVAFFPSDHHYVNTPAFHASVQTALNAVEEYPHSVLMIGAKPTHPEVEYGWIQPGRTLVDSPTNPLQRVSRFWEKPGPRQARLLLERGCLWNTFVTVGWAGAFLELLQAAVPQLAGLLAGGSPNRGLDEIYASAPVLDFSKSVLSLMPSRLVVLQDSLSGWTDLGNPDRVMDAVTRHAVRPDWLVPFRKALGASAFSTNSGRVLPAGSLCEN